MVGRRFERETRVAAAALAASFALTASTVSATPPADAHSGRPYWTLAKLNRIAISAIVVVKGTKYLAIFLSCRGEGRSVVRDGKRAWTHFTCTAPLSRGPRNYGRARFRVHVLDAEKRFITSDGRFLSG
jgi:hypothetical protein